MMSTLHALRWCMRTKSCLAPRCPPTHSTAPVLGRVHRCCLGTTVSSDHDTSSSDDSSDNEQSSHGPGLGGEQESREAILRASLPFVHEHGWTSKALAAGAKSAGFPSISHGMFSRGGVELICYFYRDSNKALCRQMEAELAEFRTETDGSPKFHVGPFVKRAVETRLRMITPYIDQWPQAIAIQSLPPNMGEALGNLSTLVDDIWYYAGDRSVDMNWYSKRVSLAAVYKSTEICLVQDKSPDYTDTWQFLDRRMANLAEYGTTMKQMQQNCDALWEGVTGMYIMTRNMLGMNDRYR